MTSTRRRWLGPSSWRSAAPRRIFVALCLVVGTLSAACSSTRSAETPSPLTELRRTAPTSKDPDLVGRWLVAELISPGGNAARAERARKRLLALGPRDLVSHFSLGLDAAMHGRPATASDHYLRAVRAARDSTDPRAPLIAWFSARQAALNEGSSEDLFGQWEPFIKRAIADPRQLGWRARSELVEWSINKAWERAAGDVEKRAVELYGCLTKVRLAGPFGSNAGADSYRSFSAEKPGVWPVEWKQNPDTGRSAKLVTVEQQGCLVEADEPTTPGVFYAESFITLAETKSVLIAVQGALAVLVNDVKVLDRDIRKWGIWPKFGVQVRLPAGRHRIVARLREPSTSIRVMRPDGTPLALEGSDDPSAGYSVIPPVVSVEPNELMRYIQDGDIVDPGEDLLRFVAAYLCHIESSNDVASVLVEPLLADLKRATGPTLSLAAGFAEGDPIFSSNQREDLVRELHEQAVSKDDRLWAANISLALGEAERKGAADAVPKIEKLAKRFDRVPEVQLALARVYGELGWAVEHRRAVKRLVEQFPNNLNALYAAVDVYDAEGDFDAADRLVKRILKLDPDTEILLGRALARRNYERALAELERLKKRRPNREDIAERIYDVMVRAGNESETWKKLEAAIEQSPRNGRARLELADARYASGAHDALRKALAEAVETGADTGALSAAIDLVEGMTALEPYRLDTDAIISAYEAAGRHMPGNAARVLDYAALWVRSDGSSQMLEHEIIRIQSAEAISAFAEHRRLDGLVLHMRVIKQNGEKLEPEFVAGKPTVTFPHLEVGDYIETEQVMFFAGDGRGARYVGPRWFFREENVAYARSEFVVISPKHKELVVETTGNVPEPETTAETSRIIRRWRVDFSPAAPEEPNSAPVSEFLPSVRIGWGVSLGRTLRQLADAVADVTPVDPRIVRIAEGIVEPLPSRDRAGRAKRLYRWALENIEDGEENDGRRVVISKHGNRWRGFLMLCRALDIPVRYAVAKSRLAPPPKGPLSRASLFSQPLLVLDLPKGPAWLTLSNKYAPFGYVPDEVRGMPAYFLSGQPGTLDEPVRVAKTGASDGIAFEGHGKLSANGSFELALGQRFSGRVAMALRNGLSQLPEKRLREAVESNLLARTMHGANLIDYEIKNRDDLDSPLIVRMKVELPRFAQVRGSTVVVSPPFTLPLSRLAALPSRQTPLLISEPVHRSVRIRIDLPKGATVSGVAPAELSFGQQRVVVSDSVEGGTLVLERHVDIPAGRVQPEAYTDFAKFARRADDALSRALRVQLGR